ncbi:MAG TPA: hypothetical protein VIL48_03260 [Acidimicrobiales bacterium]
MSFGLLHAERDWSFFDVLHVHSLELAGWDSIQAVLDRCEREHKGVLVTVHDVAPMFETHGDGYRQKLAGVAERGIPMATLTEGAANRLSGLLGDGPAAAPVVTPHGYVVPPGDRRFGSARSRGRAGVTFLLYGGFRPNRVMYPACVNAGFGLPDEDRLRVLTRGISPIELRDGTDAKETVDFSARMRGRIDLRICPFPSDDDVVRFLLTGQVLVMPYLWSTHSGQLETAFDLGLVPVVADVGFVREQWERHGGLVPEPVWFDWSDGSEYAYGSRLTEALLRARERVVAGDSAAIDGFREHRRAEHELVLDQHAALYEAAMASCPAA